jgi:aspartyl-tRNA(Asn)/glutamyl-tRNA(Gln) amidotransferase subunit C
MKISRQEVEHVALLARLRLSGEEMEQFTGQFNAILTYMEKLNELDTEDVDPTSHVIDVGNVVREDRALESIPVEEVLANAPDAAGGFLKVPRIL